MLEWCEYLKKLQIECYMSYVFEKEGFFHLYVCSFLQKKIDTYSFGWKIRTKRTGYIPSITCLP